MRLALFIVFSLAVATLCSAQETGELAPGAPGQDAQWESAGKVGVGTSASLESKVWFTLQGGVLTEVYYPTVDVANVRLLQFVVVSADGKRVETEENMTHRVEAIDPRALTFRQINTSKSGAYMITKTYTTDHTRTTVLIDVRFRPRNEERLYVYYDPSLNNSGMHDSAWTTDNALLASDADKASALVFSPRPKQIGGFGKISNGYFETSDGLVELRRNGQFKQTFARAADGNVVQVAQIPPEYTGLLAEQGMGFSDTSDTAFTLALGSLAFSPPPQGTESEATLAPL